MRVIIGCHRLRGVVMGCYRIRGFIGLLRGLTWCIEHALCLYYVYMWRVIL
jgi:hypothetical protein